MSQSTAVRQMSSDVVDSVLHTTRLFRRFEEIVAASAAHEARAAVQAAINRLTYEIAKASAKGHSSLTVLQLRSRQNFRREIWDKRLWYRRPCAKHLFEDARAIYDYCLANGLNPSFANYEYDDEYRQLLSSMQISWNNLSLVRELTALGAREPSTNVFSTALNSLMLEEVHLDVVARARRSHALLIMPVVIRNLDQAAKEGRAESVVYRQSERSHFAPEIPYDIKDFCVLLGLKAQLATASIDGEKYTKVLVSGWTETHF